MIGAHFLLDNNSYLILIRITKNERVLQRGTRCFLVQVSICHDVYFWLLKELMIIAPLSQNPYESDLKEKKWQDGRDKAI